MPRVPVYDAPRVARRPLPDAQARPAQTDLPQLGAAILGAGQTLGDFAQREQERRNADAIFRAEAALTEEYLQFETGLRQRRGQNAWGVTEDVRHWWDTKGREYLEGLENDAQRVLFGQTVTKLRERSLDSAAKYEEGERRRSLEESAAASIAMAINRAAAQHHDDDAIADAKRDVLDRIAVQAGFNGWSTERKQAEEEIQLTELHKQVLEAMADSDPERAKKYYAKHKAEIAGAAQDELKAIIDRAGIRAKAQRETDRLMALGLDEEETLRRARREFEDEERDEIVRRVEKRFAEQRAFDERRKRETADAAWDIFARNGNSVDALPTAILEQLDGRTLQSLRAAEPGAPKVETDWEIYHELRRAAVEDPRAFELLDLRRFFGVLAEPERRQVLTLQEQIREPGRALDVATFEQQMNESVRGLRLADKELGEFKRRAQDEVFAEQERIGRSLNQGERQAIIDRLLIEGRVEGGGLFGLWDPRRRLFEIPRDDYARFDIDVEAIPEREREKIVEALTREGKEASDENIVITYRAVHGF